MVPVLKPKHLNISKTWLHTFLNMFLLLYLPKLREDESWNTERKEKDFQAVFVYFYMH